MQSNEASSPAPTKAQTFTFHKGDYVEVECVSTGDVDKGYITGVLREGEAIARVGKSQHGIILRADGTSPRGFFRVVKYNPRKEAK